MQCSSLCTFTVFFTNTIFAFFVSCQVTLISIHKENLYTNAKPLSAFHKNYHSSFTHLLPPSLQEYPPAGSNNKSSSVSNTNHSINRNSTTSNNTTTSASTVAATTAANNAKNNPVRVNSASSESPRSEGQPLSPPTNQRAANIRWGPVYNLEFRTLKSSETLFSVEKTIMFLNQTRFLNTKNTFNFL